MAVVRRLRPEEWREQRAIRLSALLDTPSAFASTYAREAAAPPEHWQRIARERSSGAVNTTLVAEDEGGTWLGIVGVYRPDPAGSIAELVSMWVVPEARGRGVGEDLVDAALAWAARVGCESIELWVTNGNDGAQRLYVRCGFEVTGVEQPLPSDPCRNEVRMVRPLTP